jgi:hypothetical protein
MSDRENRTLTDEEKQLMLMIAISRNDFSELNAYYRKHPPEKIIDDNGIKHYEEVPLPANYDKNPCACGTIHLEDENTWYHSALEMTEKDYKVVKKCKTCGEILMMKLSEE